MARKTKAAPPQGSADNARKIWLAGIGAYGRAFSEAQETVAKLSSDGSRVFDDLVAKGEAIERQVEARGRKVAAKLGPAGASFEDRIKRMRERIGLGDDASINEADFRALEERVARIEQRLGAVGGTKAVKPRAKKKTTRKKTA
ncbi:MAG: phasin family protein [Parvularculaceae bacterium]